MYTPLVVLCLGIVCLVLGYQLPQAPPPVRQLLLILGWILALVGGILVVLLVLGLPVPLGR
jgi:hypothetical protein